MIIWSGCGFLVAVIAFISLLLSEYVVEALFHDQNYYQAHGWPKLLGLWISGAIVRFLSHYLNQKQSRTLVDKETGAEVQIRPNHALFFITMEYWGPILFVLGIIFLFVKE